MREHMNSARSIKIAQKYQEEGMQEEKAKYVEIGKSLINSIQNGVVCEDGRVRKFDIIDYYQVCPLKPDQLFYIIKPNLTCNEQRAFRTFQFRYEKYDKLNLDILYNTREIFGFQMDENRQVIPGSGREVFKEEKENIVKFMEDNDLPLLKVVYESLFERWKYGFLDMPTKFYETNERTR